MTNHRPRPRTRPDWCIDHGHPPVDYRPTHDRTWCLCGRVSVDGYQVTTEEES